jgi:hypothetical protein
VDSAPVPGDPPSRIAHDDPFLIVFDGQPQHLALLIGDRQGDEPMTSTGAHEVVDDLHETAPKIVRGLRQGCMVYGTSTLKIANGSSQQSQLQGHQGGTPLLPPACPARRGVCP